MKIGFLTGGQLGGLKDSLEWAAKHGFGAIAIGAGPGSRFFNVDEAIQKPGEVKKLIADSGVIVSALGFYDNLIDLDLDRRRRLHEYFMKLMEASYRLEVGVVTGWIGRIPGTVEDNMKVYAEAWPPLVKHAEDRGVKIAIENCRGNIAYRPDIWERMFKITPSKAIGLEFDPSHLIGQLIDVIDVARKFGDRIYHTHCKDAEVLWHKVRYVGIYGEGWERHRLPGLGALNWGAFITVLKESRYDYVLNIEHEDPFYNYEDGLIVARKFLSTFIP